MEHPSDAQLLQEYAKRGSEKAFGTIVERNSALVYSAALRQAGRADFAQDITQNVFADLARKARSLAGKLGEDASLVGWLYRGTRYAALTFLRNERRRQAREKRAMQDLNAPPDTSLNWDQLRPLLDEAMSNLSEADRDALLLRFFKNHDFRAVGAALGVSEDAAQKRVTRSLEKLRALLARRGLTTTATALSTAISANAVETLPSTFAATVTSASIASAASGGGSALTLLESMAITKLQFGLAGAIVLASVVTPLLLQHQAQGWLREQGETLRRRAGQVAELEGNNERLRNMLVQAQETTAPSTGQSELLKLRGEVARLRKDVEELTKQEKPTAMSRSEVLTSMARLYSDRITQVKAALETTPSEKIPEIQYLKERDWLRIIYHAKLEEEDGYRRAMSSVRLAGQNNFVTEVLQDALHKYANANHRAFPTDLSQLRPYFKSPVDDAMLQRWQIVPNRRLAAELRVDGDWAITPKAPVDAEVDQRMVVGLKTVHMGHSGISAWTLGP